jgi:hypothetical protein
MILKCTDEMYEHNVSGYEIWTVTFTQGWLKTVEAACWTEYLDLRETCKEFIEWWFLLHLCLLFYFFLILLFLLPLVQQPNMVQICLIFEVPRSNSDTPQLVGLLWTVDQLIAGTCTWQHTSLTRDIYPCLHWDSNPQSQQVISNRHLP